MGIDNMSTNPISNVGSVSTTDSAISRIPSKVLTQEDFLKLLVAQMQTQDPLDPMKDTEFVGQMVQFSVLEQNKSMQSTIASMQATQQVVQANSLLGKSVQLLDSDGTFIVGKVDSVFFDGGTPQILVNGNGYSLGQVISVQSEETTNK